MDISELSVTQNIEIDRWRAKNTGAPFGFQTVSAGARLPTMVGPAAELKRGEYDNESRSPASGFVEGGRFF